jgi:hypothetical protein
MNLHARVCTYGPENAFPAKELNKPGWILHILHIFVRKSLSFGPLFNVFDVYVLRTGLQALESGGLRQKSVPPCRTTLSHGIKHTALGGASHIGRLPP